MALLESREVAQLPGESVGLPIVEVLGSETELARNCAESALALLSRVPRKYLSGLRRIVIVRSDEAANSTRRTAKSRPGRFLLGSYFPAKSDPWIEIYVDGLEQRFGARLMSLSNARELAVGACLFHEIGHHIAHKIEPTSNDQETAAKAWTRKLLEMAFKESQPALTDDP